MKFPWTKYEFRKDSVTADHTFIMNRVCEAYPSLDRPDRIQMGDPAKYTRLLDPKVCQFMFSSLPRLPRRYVENKRDCENFTRRRLEQVADFLDDWTDLKPKETAGVWEIRGRVHHNKELVGHSMLMVMTSDMQIHLREPYNTSILHQKSTDHMRDPWLLYI